MHGPATRPARPSEVSNHHDRPSTIDPAHTDVLFSAKHMMVTTVRGTFRDVTGTLDLDEADPTARSGDVPRSRPASVDTGFGARDTHLRSADFFDAETVPGASASCPRPVEPAGGDHYRGHRRRHDP